jgi:uncharacterized cupredoxin-like copper-binding protein
MAGRAGWRLVAPLVAGACAFAVAACGSEDITAPEAEAASDGPKATQVEAKLGHAESGEFTFTLDKGSVPEGPVVFNIENIGTIEHEFELVKTNVEADKLPPKADDKTKANVEAGGGEEIKEVEDIAPGAKTKLAVDLEPGKYLIVCNLPGHYADGMVIPFTVTSKDATQIDAKLGVSSNGEYTFTLESDSAPAGDVVFNIENAGELVHEFELVKTDVAADKLPARADNKDKADVEAGGGEEKGEVEDIEPGAKTQFGVSGLEPGK